MANFGKLNFSISLNPTSAFPLDARCYFTNLRDAQIAARNAAEVGNTDTQYYYGQLLVVDDGESITWYQIGRENTLEQISTGGGTVTSVNDIGPDQNKNVLITGFDVKVSSTDNRSISAALAQKQDQLPSGEPGTYLHKNRANGQLEWASGPAGAVNITASTEDINPGDPLTSGYLYVVYDD